MSRQKIPTETIMKARELIQQFPAGKVAKMVGVSYVSVYMHTVDCRPDRKGKKPRPKNTEFFDWKDYDNSII